MHTGGDVMLAYKLRLRNRLRQLFYKPVIKKPRFISAAAVSFFDELDKTLEEKLTPLFDDLFN
jgi:hypothetical protein